MSTINTKKPARVVAACVLGCMLIGCGSGKSMYYPRLVARGELFPRYDNNVELWSANRMVAEGYRYDGLEDFVKCVPEAQNHARMAESSGTKASVLTTLGIVMGVGSLGSLGGLYFYDKDNAAMWGILGTGLIVAAAGVALAASGRRAKEDAHGHALDAMNYYNDAVGSFGATCDDLTYPAPSGPEPAALPPPAPAAPPPADATPPATSPEGAPPLPPAAPTQQPTRPPPPAPPPPSIQQI